MRERYLSRGNADFMAQTRYTSKASPGVGNGADGLVERSVCGRLNRRLSTVAYRKALDFTLRVKVDSFEGPLNFDALGRMLLKI